MKINNPIEVYKKTDNGKIRENAKALINSGLYKNFEEALKDSKEYHNNKNKIEKNPMFYLTLDL